MPWELTALHGVDSGSEIPFEPPNAQRVNVGSFAGLGTIYGDIVPIIWLGRRTEVRSTFVFLLRFAGNKNRKIRQRTASEDFDYFGFGVILGAWEKDHFS